MKYLFLCDFNSHIQIRFAIKFINQIATSFQCDSNELFHLTALHKAVMKKNYEIVELLLNQNNIDINIKDEISYFINRI